MKKYQKIMPCFGKSGIIPIADLMAFSLDSRSDDFGNDPVASSIGGGY